MPWVVLSVVGAAVVLLVVFALRFEAERREVFRQAWRDFATSRGFVWKPASGPWYRRTSDAIDGNVEGVPVRVDTFVVSTGKSHVTYTRVVSRPGNDVPAKITVSRRHFLTGFGESLGMKTVRTGDPSFDERMVVRARDPEAVRRVIDASVRARILELRPSVTVRIQDQTAKITWRGAEKDPRTLDAACRLAAAISRAGAHA